MEATKTSTSYAILQRLQSRFKIPNSRWHADAIDWIGEGIKEIGYHTGFETKAVKCVVENYKVETPYEVESINSVFHNGQQLPIIQNRTATSYNIIRNHMHLDIANDNVVLELNKETKRLKALQTMYAETPTDEILNSIVNAQEKIKLYVANSTFSNNWKYLESEWYSVEGGFIKTSFSDGILMLDANCYMLDEKGYPMVIDTQKYIMALEWFLMYNLMLGGYQHPVLSFEFVYNECFNIRMPQARNEPKLMSIERLENFTMSWNSVKRNISNVTLKSDI